MKKILITVAEDIVVRNIFLTDFWTEFRNISSKDNIQILFVVKPDLAEFFQKKFSDPKISVMSYKREVPGIFDNSIMSLARSSINSHTNLWSKMRSYYRGHSGICATSIKVVYSYIFGRFRIVKILLRKLILLVGPDNKLKEIFDSFKPTCIFASSLTNFDFDVLIAREAKRRNIKIIGMVRSWDNLSSHGLLRVVPDVLFLQNKFLFDMAVQYQDIKESICKIIGVPHYDIVRNLNKIIRPKAEVFKELGLDPNKKLIFFGAMGNFLFIHEDEMPKVFDSIIANRGFGDDIQLLYRAHPKFGLKLMENSHLSNITFDVSGKYFNQFSIDNDENNKLLNIIHHSDVVLTVASTIAIDAAVLNKPIVCINFDGQTEYKDVVYWESVRRFFDHYTHFEALISTGGVTIAKDQKELIDSVKDAIKSPSKNEKERAKIVELFVAPLDGKASQRLSKNLLDQII